jgi:hypothetical protein
MQKDSFAGEQWLLEMLTHTFSASNIACNALAGGFVLRDVFFVV